VTLGRQLRRPELPTVGASWCEAALPAGSIYRFLACERARLFPPELFADLFRRPGGGRCRRRSWRSSWCCNAWKG